MNIQLFNPREIAAKSQEMEFCELGEFDDGGAGVFRSTQGGPSPWEMHPDCDELLHVIEGAIEVEILPNEKGAGCTRKVNAGWFLIVPRGCWHRQRILSATTEFYLTPGRTLHSNAVDPRGAA